MEGIISKTLRLSKTDYYRKHLSIINPILPETMTPKEVEVLANFMALDGELSKEPFGTTGRKTVRTKMKISPGGLGNYLTQLKDKGFILQGTHKILRILPVLMPNEAEQLYQFRLLKNEK